MYLKQLHLSWQQEEPCLWHAHDIIENDFHVSDRVVIESKSDRQVESLVKVKGNQILYSQLINMLIL